MIEIETIKSKTKTKELKLKDLSRGDFFKFKDVEIISRFSKEDLLFLLVDLDRFVNLRNCLSYYKHVYIDDNVIKCELVEPIKVRELNR